MSPAEEVGNKSLSESAKDTYSLYLSVVYDGEGRAQWPKSKKCLRQGISFLEDIMSVGSLTGFSNQRVWADN